MLEDVSRGERLTKGVTNLPRVITERGSRYDPGRYVPACTQRLRSSSHDNAAGTRTTQARPIPPGELEFYRALVRFLRDFSLARPKRVLAPLRRLAAVRVPPFMEASRRNRPSPERAEDGEEI